MNSPYWSRIEGFYELDPKARREAISQLPLGLDAEDFVALDLPLGLLAADHMSENVLGSFSLPFSVAPNFLVDDKPVLIPMVTEEPSIVAAVSKMAKLTALKGGFHTEVDPPLLKGQLQFYELPDIDAASAVLREKREELIEYLNGLCPRMLKRGGGVVDLGYRVIASKVGPMLIVEPVVNVCDAMGANIVNTLMEHLALKMQSIFHKKPGLAILSNFCEQRLARARAALPFNLLATDTAHDQGEEVAARIIAAHAFAEADPYRACTHNKGILNGIDALAIATGNDFRALEAGAHAFASRNGTYAPLTSMRLDYEQKLLIAELSLPLAVGVVGANCSIHQGVKLAHKILGPFAKTSTALSSVMASLGLAQCMAALLALCQHGIQKGHMKLHQRKSLL